MARTISDETDDDGFGPQVPLGSSPSSKEALRRQLAEAAANTPGAKTMSKPANGKTSRTSQGLRDILFDEIDQLRDGDGDPSRALAIANIAKQILNTARVELDFHRAMKATEAEGEPITLGNLRLGTDPEGAVSVKKIATERS
jgi:hypothetical protein